MRLLCCEVLCVNVYVVCSVLCCTYTIVTSLQWPQNYLASVPNGFPFCALLPYCIAYSGMFAICINSLALLLVDLFTNRSAIIFHRKHYGHSLVGQTVKYGKCLFAEAALFLICTVQNMTLF
ncbi:hypothetical protein Tcan_00285 [Toxocara canis]|uniref:Uncharacterized protein n=1 Tax=Toxocara canis TaxID=6265 RepID=A0A0B2UYX0_TOXCA|nr:hypothetical protein Tcan_00285 [Toxocara canis]